MSMTVNSGAARERQRSREIMAGFVGRVLKSQQVQLETEFWHRIEKRDCSVQ